MGKVYLIGAGPGDEELITVKAVRALEKCTAVMYDRLANRSILRYLKEDCKVYYCGKEPGCHYKTQDEINDMLVSLAKEGHIVGRIKGGDPYVFGRGSEEASRLFDEGIKFEVIPGITSAISVLNYGGIPATHRKTAQSFHVFTGKSAGTLDINWSAAAKLNGTLIFLMGLDNIDTITENLIENGMDREKPCAVIMKGTTSKQQKVVGKLHNIKEKVVEAGFESPCIIVVGDVVAFNETLNWYEKKPLFGINVCITRSKEQSKVLRERLLDLGAGVLEINSIKIKNTASNLDGFINNLGDYDYIVLTSVNGVNIFFNHLIEKGIDIRSMRASFGAIGPATAMGIRERGIIPKIMGEKYAAEDLFEIMKSQVKKGDRVLLPRSGNARPYLYDALSEAGCMVDEAPIYEVVEGDKRDVSLLKDADIILFTSPSTVKNIISMAGIEKIKGKKCLAIGPITAKELEANDIKPYVCSEYTVDGALEKLMEIWRDEDVCKA